MAEGGDEIIGLLQEEYKEKERINVQFLPYQTGFCIKAIGLHDKLYEEEASFSNLAHQEPNRENLDQSIRVSSIKVNKSKFPSIYDSYSMRHTALSMK